MAAIQQSILGILQTAQQGIAFGKHLKTQAKGVEIQRETAIEELTGKAAESEKQVGKAKEGAVAAQKDVDVAQAQYDEIYQRANLEQDPTRREEIIATAETAAAPGELSPHQQLGAAKERLSREEQVLSLAEKRLESQYQRLARLEGGRK